MGATPEQDVDVHLARGDQQGVGVARRDDGVAMGEADAEAAVGDDLGERQVGRVDVEIALHQLQVGGHLAEKLERMAVGQVAQAQDLADLAGRQELPELQRQGQWRERLGWREAEQRGQRGRRTRTERTFAGRSWR